MGRILSLQRHNFVSLTIARRGLLILLALVLPLLGFAQEPGKSKLGDDEVENLLKEFPKGWLHFSSEPTSPLNATWQIVRDADDVKEPKDAVLICMGKPDGYIRTEKEYEDFEMGMEWKYPTDPNGNSGILLYTVEKDMIWPKSVQIQLHRPTAGSVFASIGAKVDNPLPAKDLSKPVNEWNDCLITSLDGKLTVTVNGHKIGEVTGCMPHKGCVGLQSEGSEIHFRKLWIKPILPADKRTSSRKPNVRHKKTPECPPQYVTTTLPDGQLLFLTPHGNKNKPDSQRVARILKRFETHGKLPHGAFVGLSPFGVPESPMVPK